MRPGVYSKARIALFLLLIGAILFSFSASFGQEAAAGGANPTEVAPPGKLAMIMGLIKDNIDLVFITIMLCSVIAVTLIIKCAIQVRSSVMLPEASITTIREMIANRQFKELLEFTENDPSFISKSLNPALKRAPSFSAMKEALETALGEQSAEQFRKIEYLNIIGNLGPLLGLLGTVLGMIQSFWMMKAKHGDARPDDLAGGISAALVHTFLGLLLAIPCLAAFGVLRTVVDRLTIRGSLLAEEMLMAIKPQEAKAPASTAIPAAKKPATATAEL